MALTCGLSISAAVAQDASPWAREPHAAVRLLAGSRGQATVLGAIAFSLDAGWKTYWRNPGDSGVPPRFDFSASDNVESVTVLWPAPMAFPDGAGGTSYGYKDQLVLPLRIVPKDKDRPVLLRNAMSYAVCEKICIPAEARLELQFAGTASSEDPTLAAWLDAVPKPAKIGSDAPIAITGIDRAANDQMTVDVRAPPDAAVELFVEGPTSDWSLPPPRLISRSGHVLRFGFALDGLPTNATADGAMLKLTLVGREQDSKHPAVTGAYEVETSIGPPPSK